MKLYGGLLILMENISMENFLLSYLKVQKTL
nr:MAG TPA: hypothetical protein [Caudoviricetes sp.]